MTTTPDPFLTRRALLAGLGGIGATWALASCTSDAKISTGSGTTVAGNASGGSGQGATSPGAVNMAPRFDQELFAVSGSEQRLVVSFVNKQGEPPKDLPNTIEFTTTVSGKPVGAPVMVSSHQDGVPQPYFPVRFTPDQPGIYTLTAKVGAESPTTTFKVVAPDKNPLIAIGQKLRAADTPTTADERGVTPICTRVGASGADPCPLHDLNLRDALTTGKPIALLISTPAFCQIGVCGPVLDLVLDQRGEHPEVQFIHAEVYQDPKSGSQDTAPIIGSLGLNYEPALFLASADGTVVERLDYVFDRTEIAAAFAGLAKA